MPTDSAKLTEAVIIDLSEYKVRLVEKKYEMLNGDKINYLSERFLQCYADLAPKKKFQILNKVINDINNHYPEDGIAKRLDMKSRLREEFSENQAFKVNEIGDKLFGNHQGKKQEFDEKIERYDMQYDTFTVAKENTVKRLEYQMLETDTGIEIKIPMEEYNMKDNDIIAALKELQKDTYVSMGMSNAQFASAALDVLKIEPYTGSDKRVKDMIDAKFSFFDE